MITPHAPMGATTAHPAETGLASLTPIAIPGALSPADCDAAVALAQAALFDDAGLVRGVTDGNIRRARIAWIEDEGPGAWLFRRVVETVAEANRAHFGFALSDFAERAQIAWYGADERGHFGWHADIGDGPLARRRKLTLVVQLSDPADYDGGILETNAQGWERAAPRGRGTAILFPSFTLHRVTPVTRGARYSLTTWVHGPAFR